MRKVKGKDGREKFSMRKAKEKDGQEKFYDKVKCLQNASTYLDLHNKICKRLEKYVREKLLFKGAVQKPV